MVETHVLQQLSATDRCLLSRVSSECRDAVVASPLPRAGVTQLPFLVKDFVESVELLQWSRLQGPGFDIIDARTFALAAGSRSGTLEVMRFLEGFGCPWDRTAFAKAARQGNLKALKWLQYEWGNPYDLGQNKWDKEKLNNDHTLCASAASGGHMEMLPYLRAQGIQ